MELQQSLWGDGEGRSVLAALYRPVQGPGLSRAHNKRRQGEREKGGAGARAHSEPPYPLGGEASRPGPERHGEEHGRPNSLSRYCQARIPSEPGTHDVRAPEPGLARPGQRAGAYARAAVARGSARGLLGPSGRKRAWERGGARTSQGPKRPVLPAALGSRP